MSLSQAIKNFRWRIETTTPTSSATQRSKFHWIDPAEVSADQSSGTVRGFYVRWLESARAEEVEDMANRLSLHRVEVSVHYPRELPLQTLQTLMLDDRDDLLTTLRDDRTWTGYDASNTSDDIGLYSREFLSDSVVEVSEYTVALRQVWQCLVLESE